jgi:hypothetical protein
MASCVHFPRVHGVDFSEIRGRNMKDSALSVTVDVDFTLSTSLHPPLGTNKIPSSTRK